MVKDDAKKLNTGIKKRGVDGSIKLALTKLRMVFTVDCSKVSRGRDNEGCCNLNTSIAQVRKTQGSLLKQAFFASQAEKLLGETRAGQRPQSRA